MSAITRSSPPPPYNVSCADPGYFFDYDAFHQQAQQIIEIAEQATNCDPSDAQRKSLDNLCSQILSQSKDSLGENAESVLRCLYTSHLICPLCSSVDGSFLKHPDFHSLSSDVKSIAKKVSMYNPKNPNRIVAKDCANYLFNQLEKKFGYETANLLHGQFTVYSINRENGETTQRISHSIKEIKGRTNQKDCERARSLYYEAASTGFIDRNTFGAFLRMLHAEIANNSTDPAYRNALCEEAKKVHATALHYDLWTPDIGHLLKTIIESANASPFINTMSSAPQPIQENPFNPTGMVGSYISWIRYLGKNSQFEQAREMYKQAISNKAVDVKTFGTFMLTLIQEKKQAQGNPEKQSRIDQEADEVYNTAKQYGFINNKQGLHIQNLYIEVITGRRPT